MNCKFTLLIILLYFPLIGWSQVEQNLDPVPHPYDYNNFFAKKKEHGIRQITSFNSDLKTNVTDTVFLETYDKKGKPMIKITYGRGKKWAHILYVNSVDTNLKEFKSIDVKTREVNSVNKTYSKSNKIQFIKDFYLQKRDTTARVESKYIYGDDGRLVKIESYADGKIYQYFTYYYEGKNLIRKETHTMSRTNGNYSQTEYIYDANKILTERIESLVRNNKKEPFKTSNYTFANGKLTSEEYFGGNMLDKRINVNYFYDANNRPIKIISKHGDYSQTLLYEYKGENLAKISLKGNHPTLFIKEFALLYGTLSEGSPITCELIFTYDSKRNLIQDQYNLNGEVISIKSYKVEYY